MHSIVLWPTVVAVLIATFTDLRDRRIPNWLVFPFMAAGPVVSGIMGGWHGLLQSAEGFAVGAGIFGVLAFMGGMGMGDLKLCAAIGTWIGPSQLMFALVMTAIAGGVMALCWAAFGGFLGDLLQNTGNLVIGFKDRGLKPNPEFVLENPKTRKMPYAPAIAFGTLFSFLSR